MAIIAGMLNGTNQNKDADFQAMPSFLLSAGVRKNFSTEFLVETNLVKAGQAFVKVKRESVSPNEEFIIPITLTADTVIDTSGTGYVCLTVNSAKVNDGGSNAVDGTGIAQIEVLGTLPTKNFLLLATLASGVLTDSRVFSKLSDEILSFLTAEDVGLENVPNLEMATQAEAEAGTAEDKFMSPLRVLQSIQQNGGSPSDEAYSASWDGDMEVPTKNAVYDKINSMDGYTSGLLARSLSAGTSTQAVPHGLGRIPKKISLTSMSGQSNGSGIQSQGVFINGVGQSCIYIGGNGSQFAGSSSTYSVFQSPSTGASVRASLDVDETNITFSWSSTGSPSGSSFYVLWEAC